MAAVGKKNQVVRVLLILGLLALLAYYLYFGRHPPGPLAYLATSYSFSTLWDLTVGLLGKSTLVVLGTGFAALAAYLTSLPTSGGFSTLDPRNAGMFLANQILVWLLAALVLVGLLVFFDSLVSTLVFYIPVVIASALSTRSIATDLSYKDLAKAPANALMGQIDTMYMRRFAAPRILLLIVAGEVIYILEYNPSFPLLAWFFLLYAYMGAILTMAQSEGYAFQLINARYVRATETDGKVLVGFLVSRGPEHFVITTEEITGLLVPASSIKEIQILEKPKPPPAAMADGSDAKTEGEATSQEASSSSPSSGSSHPSPKVSNSIDSLMVSSRPLRPGNPIE
jgi:hypothetical protein